jgi:predicted transcriptional regulator of viral defense system
MKRTALGIYGAKFFALMQMRHQGRVTLGELQAALGLTASQEKTLLMRLARNGYIFRLQRGIYLVPSYIPSGGSWQPNELYIIAQYMEIQQASYFISGQYAFHYYGLSQQLAAQLTVYNNKISGIKKFGRISMKFIKIPRKQVTGYMAVNIGNDLGEVNIATLERTVLDAINDSRYRLLPEAYTWLEQHAQQPKFLKQFFELVLTCAKKNTIRRVGYYLENKGFLTGLEKLSELVQPSTAWVQLVSNNSYKGINNKKWGIIDNA